MKIHYSPLSPFVRKVMVVAIELGLDGRIQRLPAAPHPVDRDAGIIASNPLGQVPTFFTDDGTVLYDSRVVCEYLDDLGKGGFFPPAGPARWRVLTEQSLADGLLDAALLARYERLARPPELKWQAWEDGQIDKIRCALDKLETLVQSFAGRLDIGTITTGCALGYLDLRFGDLEWRKSHPALAGWFAEISKRRSFAETVPVL